MVTSHKFKRPANWDPHYISSLIERDLGMKVAGITEREGELLIHFESALTQDQKTKLDRIMANSPQPARYEYGALDLEEVIESEVGMKPVRVTVDEATEHVIVDFESALAPQQEARLENTLKILRRLKRRK